MYERLQYDERGNIMKLVRNSNSLADTVAMNYAYENSNLSNRLKSITKGSTTNTYTYDVNGNATKDRTGMTFTYNHLNLPKTATKSGTSVTYLYDASGSKLRKTAVVSGVTSVRDYVGGIEYSKVGTASQAIEMIHTGEGYLQRNTDNTYNYHYNLTDHLGNVRATLQRASATTGTVIQKHDYYPFGKSRALQISGINKYLYNGKEVQSELGDQQDYGARFYDPEIGRWNVVDPLAEAARDWSPYRYGYNNPIKFTDPTGMLESTEVEEQKDGTFKVVGGEKDNDRNIYIVDKDGKRTGEILGQSLSSHSFLDEHDNPVIGAIIDPKSTEGQDFIDDLEKKDPTALGYAWNARNNRKYDFKSKDIGKNKHSDQTDIQYYYRGSKTKDGEYGSARDFGNFGAGLVVARSYVLNWKSGRLGFDTYQGFKSKGVTFLGAPMIAPTPTVIPVEETTGTVKAQMRGYIYGIQKYK